MFAFIKMILCDSIASTKRNLFKLETLNVLVHGWKNGSDPRADGNKRVCLSAYRYVEAQTGSDPRRDVQRFDDARANTWLYAPLPNSSLVLRNVRNIGI